MKSALGVLMFIGPLALIGAFAAALIYYLSYRDAGEPTRHRSVVRYVLVVFGLGVAAYLIGTIVGVAAACSSENAGNLCGLVGVFGAGPLLSAVAILLYAHSWAKNARRAP
jgi:hypothetical protein